MARILIADVETSARRLEVTLSKTHKLRIVSSIDDALKLLSSEPFDAIICGMHFDSCRMIELLRAVKQDDALQRIPFVCWQNDASELPEALVTGAQTAATVLGACLYLTHQQVLEMSDADLRNAIEKCLAPLDHSAPI